MNTKLLLAQLVAIGGAVAVDNTCFGSWVWGYDPEIPEVGNNGETKFVTSPEDCQTLCQGVDDETCNKWIYNTHNATCFFKSARQVAEALSTKISNLGKFENPQPNTALYCNLEIPHECADHHYNCLKCDADTYSCVFEQEAYVTGPRFCDGSDSDDSCVIPPYSTTTTTSSCTSSDSTTAETTTATADSTSSTTTADDISSTTTADDISSTTTADDISSTSTESSSTESSSSSSSTDSTSSSSSTDSTSSSSSSSTTEMGGSTSTAATTTTSTTTNNTAVIVGSVAAAGLLLAGAAGGTAWHLTHKAAKVSLDSANFEAAAKDELNYNRDALCEIEESDFV